ncbi:hypothetical protein ACI2J7_01350 [Serratia bockelmannii]|uniref:hypothetical protein n=1 Tax=Serratia bockelmannii TaxID=2703793 RepID=UPI00384AC03D
MVQRYNPDYVMHAARFEPFARENEHGEFVKFSDYEVLKAERDALEVRLRNALTSEQEALQRAHAANQTADALAVENAALKDAMHPNVISGEVLDVFSDMAKYDHESCGPWIGSWIKNADEVIRAVMGSMANTETPATDAALAAIQAQGVEKLIKLKMEQLASMHPDTHAFGATAESLRAQINELQAFAANIREAK